ncbi:MAG TPA: 3-deoxy-D-manno-octulosonic acid transferase [Thermoanaerobaculia bacterium]|nr:3-deoxy-D-manno-octulosonic acid transferase [Thermoanaerobaculia bacterium]
MFALYEALLWAVFLVLLPWSAMVGFLRGKYFANFRERLGFYREERSRHDLWIQAVSVGEVAAARSLAARLREVRPALSLVITTTTLTGQGMARRLFPHDTVTYFPFDFRFSVRRFLTHHRPRLYAAIETEIWPNAARLASGMGTRIAIVNGRISDRSFGRYRKIAWFLRRVFQYYDAVLVRSESDRERFEAIGVAADRVRVTGNLKFDLREMTSEPPEVTPELLRLARGRPIFIAGSTMEGEDEMILPHLPRLIAKGCFVVIAPRKPERFEIVAGLLATSGLRWARRSEMADSPAEEADLLLLDSIGELARIYRFGVAAFVGGSLVPSGGHNPIEPASAGTPVAFGPHMENFREIGETFLESGGAVQIETSAHLIAFVEKMIADRAAREELSARGRQVVETNGGAAVETARRLLELLDR